MTESRQQKRARERSQAKQNKRQSSLGYIPSEQADFQPDAGINSQPGQVNHYWFQTMEWIPDMVSKAQRGIGDRVEEDSKGEKTIEFNFMVDIMDEEGNQRVIEHPKNGEGFMLTMVFYQHEIEQLADQIAKGGMSVRLSGIPDSEEIPRGHFSRPERVKLVRFHSVWSKGNHSGNMTFVSPQGVITSSEMAQALKKVAQKLPMVELA